MPRATEIKLSRAQRRQMQKLADKVDRVTQADRLFFERFPHRQHRIRIASAAEIEQQTIIDGEPPWVPPGYHLFAIIRNISPGCRLRLFAPGPPSVDTDAPEDRVGFGKRQQRLTSGKSRRRCAR